MIINGNKKGGGWWGGEDGEEGPDEADRADGGVGASKMNRKAPGVGLGAGNLEIQGSHVLCKGDPSPGGELDGPSGVEILGWSQTGEIRQ